MLITLVFVVICQLFLLCYLTTAFQFTSTRRTLPLRQASLVIHASPLDTPAWVIEEDSSEVSCESSTELLRRREEEERKQKEALAMQITAQQREQQNILKSVVSMFNSTTQPPSTPTTTTPSPVVFPKVSAIQSAPTTTIPSSTQLSQNKNTAFDFGLLIAFPFIIGTLALFFMFPLIGPQLAKTLPPPMSY